jgi:hypothetical protein
MPFSFSDLFQHARERQGAIAHRFFLFVFRSFWSFSIELCSKKGVKSMVEPTFSVKSIFASKWREVWLRNKENRQESNHQTS